MHELTMGPAANGTGSVFICDGVIGTKQKLIAVLTSRQP